MASGFWVLSATWFVSALLMYIYVHQRNWASVARRPIKHQLVAMFARVPNDESSPWAHMVAGSLLLSAIAILVAMCFARLVEIEDPAAIVTCASMGFSVLVGLLSFWTLWQTKRIEDLQGRQIDSFAALRDEMHQEMTFVYRDMDKTAGSAAEYHRFLLVTANPFFGMLSYPEQSETLDFYQAIEHLVNQAKKWDKSPPGIGANIKILCADRDGLTDFHAKFLGVASTNPSVATITNKVEEKLAALNKMLPGCVARYRGVPTFQFCVVGNTVFEFVLESPGLRTEIRRSQRIADAAACRRFVDVFRIMAGNAG